MFLEKFEIKVKDLKAKLGEKRLSVIFFCIFGVVVLFGLQMANIYGRSRQINSDTNNRTLYNMIGNMKNAEVFLEKARVTTTKEQQIATLVEVLSQINLAKEGLASLPVNQDSMNNISKFLTQTSDVSKSMIKKLAVSKLEEKDYDLLEQINIKVIVITDILDDIYGKIEKGRLQWDEVERQASKELKGKDNILLSGVENMKNNFIEYEGLIYDGAYSSHLESKTALLIENLGEVTISQAKEKAIECVIAKYSGKKKPNIYNVEYTGEIDGKIGLHCFNILLEKSSNPITVQITKKGGLLYLMLQDRTVKTSNISRARAEEIGREYLENIGIDSMVSTYTIEENGMMTINYAYLQEAVTIYTDLVKVKIALDNGEVCSVECGGYIFNHHKRDNLTPLITKENARKVLNEKLEVQSEGLAIIPNDMNQEVLAYEFKGKVDKREFIIYINSLTGMEEEVLIILETKGGKLTM